MYKKVITSTLLKDHLKYFSTPKNLTPRENLRPFGPYTAGKVATALIPIYV